MPKTRAKHAPAREASSDDEFDCNTSSDSDNEAEPCAHEPARKPAAAATAKDKAKAAEKKPARCVDPVEWEEETLGDDFDRILVELSERRPQERTGKGGRCAAYVLQPRAPSQARSPAAACAALQVPGPNVRLAARRHQLCALAPAQRFTQLPTGQQRHRRVPQGAEERRSGATTS